MLSYWALIAYVGSLTFDHLAVGSVILGLYYAGKRWPLSNRLLWFFLPFLLTGILYDSMAYYGDLIRGRIRIAEPYEFDLRYFGIQTQAGVLTPNEFIQRYWLHPVLDFFTGLAYLCFVLVHMAVCAYFVFILSRRGTLTRTAAYIQSRALLSSWCFFWVNVIGYSTYFWYPAAEPWYVAQYGLEGPPRMDIRASAAGCERFDVLLGVDFFAKMYGRANDVYGAIPSLHIAYPLIAALFAFQFGALRVFCSLFFVWMCFSAVYLNHHYVLDILWGSVYAIGVWALANWVTRHKSAKKSALRP